MYHFGWFSSGRDPAARQLLSSAYDAMHSGDVEAEIDFVFINRVPGESVESDAFIELATGYGLPVVCYSYEIYRRGRTVEAGHLPGWRLSYDSEVISRLTGFKPDVCILAGYMLIVGPEMCHKFDMVNLHPAAPGGPTGTWKEVIRKLISSRSEESGVMMHLVTPELDRGPVVTFCTYSLKNQSISPYWKALETRESWTSENCDEEYGPLFDAIRREGLKREFPLIISTMKALAGGRIAIIGKTVRDASGKIIQGFDLTAEIDRFLGM